MKKLFILLAVVLTVSACSNKTVEGDAIEIPTDGLLGEDAPELYKMMYDIGQSMHQCDSLRMIADSYGHGNNSEEVRKVAEEEYPEAEARYKQLLDDFGAKIKEVAGKIEGKEVKVTLEKGMPAKIVEPFDIVDLKMGSPIGLSFDVVGVVQLTQSLSFDGDFRFGTYDNGVFKATTYDGRDSLISNYSVNSNLPRSGFGGPNALPAGQKLTLRIHFYNMAQFIYKQEYDKGFWETNHIEISHITDKGLSEFVDGNGQTVANGGLPIEKIIKTIEGYESQEKLVSNMKKLGYTQTYRNRDQYEEEVVYVFTKDCTADKEGNFIKVNSDNASVVVINKYMDGGYYGVSFVNEKDLPAVKAYAKKSEGSVEKDKTGWTYSYSYGY